MRTVFSADMPARVHAASHLTGIYPAWWTGKRFRKPVKIWAAGDTSKTVREIIQAKLLGEPGQLGTGMIPGDLISKITHKSGVADAIRYLRRRTRRQAQAGATGGTLR